MIPASAAGTIQQLCSGSAAIPTRLFSAFERRWRWPSEYLIPSRLRSRSPTCSYVHLLRREPDDALRMLAQWIALAKEIRLVAHNDRRGQVPTRLGARSAGARSEGVREMRKAIAAICRDRCSSWHPTFLFVSSHMPMVSPATQARGWTYWRERWRIARSGAKYQLPELLRTKGDLLLRLNPNDTQPKIRSDSP